MSQPPWDEKLEPYYLLHYTYGMDYTLEGVFTPGKIGAWRFDKRSYADKPPPRRLGQPPAGMQNQLVSAVGFFAALQAVHSSLQGHVIALLYQCLHDWRLTSTSTVQVRHLISAINEATDHIPAWDEYSAGGKATQLWDGNL